MHSVAELASHFDALAPVWTQSPVFDSPAEAEHILRLLKPEGRGTGLDLASGSGHLTAGLAAAGGRLLAADASERMLKLAACRFVEQRITNIVITVQDAHRLEFTPGLAHWAVCRWAWRYFAEPAQVLSELARVTKPGARLYLSDWCAPAAPLDGLFRELDCVHGRVLDEAWWTQQLAGLPFTVEHRRKRLERLDPAHWGLLGGLPEEEALRRYGEFRATAGEGLLFHELDGRPVVLAERLELVLTRIARKPA